MRTYSAVLVSLVLAVAACEDNKNPPTPGPTSVPPNDLAQVTPQDLSGAPPPADMAAPAPTPTTHEVSATNFVFSPASITIRVGDTVRWTNTSSTPHTVTSGAGSTASGAGSLFDAQLLSASSTFSFTFTTAGTQPYFCRFHEAMGMTGTVIVNP